MLENKESNFKFSDKLKLYFKLGFNFILNFFILLILFVGIYDISILNSLQSIYLILAVIDWICITTYYFIKLISIPLDNLPSIKYCSKFWNIFHIPAFILIFIGVIYDLFKVFSSSGLSGIFMYYLLFIIICGLFICFSLNDFKNIEKQYQLSKDGNISYQLNKLHEEEMKDARSFKIE